MAAKTSMTKTDQDVWKKIMASKNKTLSQDMIQSAIPGVTKKQLQMSISALLQAQLLVTSAKNGTTMFHAISSEEAKKSRSMTDEQKLIYGLITGAGDKGISSRTLRNHIGSDSMTAPILRKNLEALEKIGKIKQFKSINQPTIVLYVISSVNPPEDIAGGVWYDGNKEYDAHFVDTISNFFIAAVSKATFPSDSRRNETVKQLVPNAIYPIGQTPKLLTPHKLLKKLVAAKLTSVKLTVKNVMEVMRALELDGEVEAVRPRGSVDFESDGEVSDEAGPSTKRRKTDNASDEEVDEDLKAKDVEKARMKAAEKKRREKEKRAKEEKAKKKEARRKKKEKKREKKRKAKEKKKAKEKEKRKRKKRIDSDEESNYEVIDSDDELRDVNEVEKKKSKKRRRSSTVSSASSSSASSSSDDSDSDSDDDSESEAEDSDSIDSDDMDDADIPFRPVGSKSREKIDRDQLLDFAFSRTNLTDLDDTHVVYRATRRYNVTLGQTQTPCGKCPQFSFCEEAGPVNPDDCVYYGDWLADVNGGWDADARKKYKRVEEEEPPSKAEEDLVPMRDEDEDMAGDGAVLEPQAP